MYKVRGKRKKKVNVERDVLCVQMRIFQEPLGQLQVLLSLNTLQL